MKCTDISDLHTDRAVQFTQIYGAIQIWGQLTTDGNKKLIKTNKNKGKERNSFFFNRTLKKNMEFQSWANDL